ncbi:MAG: PQQ-dependent sugar dehydrogenase [Acidimicrobiales bacterium]
MMVIRNMSNRQRIAGAAAAGVLVVGGAGFLVLRDDDSSSPPDPGDPVEQTTSTGNTRDSEDTTTTTTPSAPAPLADVTLTAVEIGQFDAPIALVERAEDQDLYVAERGGRVVRLTVEGEGGDRSYTPADEPVIDISDEVTTDGERGLLDIAFSPDGTQLFLSYSQAPEGTSRVISYDFDGTAVDLGSRREIISVEDFAPNHNGGDIQFGPDGYLWFAMGDGGGAGDPAQTAQDTNQLLGKLIRIDPLGATDGEPYAIPEDNPFVDGSGGRPEIWLYGVRNPWRFSFDSATSDLWIGDVGQNAWEEIDFLPASAGTGRGANLGWSEMEANHPFEGGTNPPGAVIPIFEYPTGASGCAVTGGVIYHGTANPGLDGAYLFGDFCESNLRAIRQSGGQVVDERTFDVEVPSLVSFGVDRDGDVYAVSLDGGIYRLDP